MLLQHDKTLTIVGTVFLKSTSLAKTVILKGTSLVGTVILKGTSLVGTVILKGYILSGDSNPQTLSGDTSIVTIYGDLKFMTLFVGTEINIPLMGNVFSKINILCGNRNFRKLLCVDILVCFKIHSPCCGIALMHTATYIGMLPTPESQPTSPKG